MNVRLGKHFEEMIRSKVESGLYANASEVVREALRRFEVHEEKLARLRAKIAVAEAQLTTSGSAFRTVYCTRRRLLECRRYASRFYPLPKATLRKLQSTRPEPRGLISPGSTEAECGRALADSGNTHFSELTAPSLGQACAACPCSNIEFSTG
jgi:antitoxin ParD1/3/4